MRRLHLVDGAEDGSADGISWLTHLRMPINQMLGFLLNLRSFGLGFNSARAHWDGVPDEMWPAFRRVFMAVQLGK